MKRSDLLKIGNRAVQAGVFDIRLRAAFLKMRLMASKKNEALRRNAEDHFCQRTRHLLLTGVIEVARPKQAKRRAA